MQTNFIFTELSVGDFKVIDGLSAGKFIANDGDEVEFRVEDLPIYVKNTKAIIESTKTTSGEIVGLPIDKIGHDHIGGAGWIVGLELDEARNIIKFIVNWTQEGIELIKSGARRFFSPSTDPVNKNIFAGSLTNYPGTRDGKGRLILRPIELSQQIKEIDMTKMIDEVLAEMEVIKTANAELAEKVAKLGNPVTEILESTSGDVTPEMAEFIANTDGAEELGKQAQEMAQRAIKDAKRKQHVKEFAAKIVGGTPDKPFGVPVRSGEIVAALLSLPDKHREFMEKLIERMWEGAIDFAEHGLNGSEFIQGKTLPAEFHSDLKMWVESGKPVKEWFSRVMPELGKASDYNLKEFAPVAKEE